MEPDQQQQGATSLTFPMDASTKLSVINQTKETLNTLGVSTKPSNGQIPIGNGTNYTTANITAGTGITVTNGAGSISIAASNQSGFSSGTSSKNMSDASADMVIAHGLGATPKYVRITAWCDGGTSAAYYLIQSIGTYNGTNVNLMYYNPNNAGTGYWQVSNGTTTVAQLFVDKNQNGQYAQISINSTNITLSWVKTGSPAGANIFVLWEAFK